MDCREKCKNYEPIKKSYLPWQRGTQYRTLAAGGAIAALKELRSRYEQVTCLLPIDDDTTVKLVDTIRLLSNMIAECQSEADCVVI